VLKSRSNKKKVFNFYYIQKIKIDYFLNYQFLLLMNGSLIDILF